MDGKNARSLVYISSGHSITFINITITHGFSKNYKIGGALTNYGTLNLINVNITNNTHSINTHKAISYGGAVYNVGDMNIYNSTFSGNKVTASDTQEEYNSDRNLPDAVAYAYGGAIYNTGTINSYNSIFNNNLAQTNTLTGSYYSDLGSHSYSIGGAIYNNGLINLFNNTLTENKVNSQAKGEEYDYKYAYAYGGSIQNNGTLIIKDSIINYNLATSIGRFSFANGGSISNNKIMDIINSSLIGNKVSTSSVSSTSGNAISYGGAIYNRGKLNLEDVNLINNSAYSSVPESFDYEGYSYGGAIFTIKSMNIIKTKFINNNVTSECINIHFIINDTIYAKGGAIYTENNLKIIKSVFINNNAFKNFINNPVMLNVSNSSINNNIYSSNNSCNYSIENNWWGNNTPNWNQILVNVNAPESWIYLKVTLSKDNINVTENTQIKTDFNWLTNGKNVTAYSNNILDGLNISYTLTKNIVKTTSIINTIQNGTSTTIFTGTKSGITNITLKTEGISTNESIFLTINALPTSTKITYITPIINPGSNMTIQASITDKNKQPITTGEVVIKINGKTLKDDYGQSIKIQVINGTINYTYHIPENYSTKQYNLTVKYLRNDKFTPSEQTINFTITKTLEKSSVTVNNEEKINYYTLANNYNPKIYNLTLNYKRIQ